MKSNLINESNKADQIQRLEAQVKTLSERIQDLMKEQELWVQMEKEAAIGRLARGVAHEINNPLQGVLGFVQLLIKKLNSSGFDRKLALQNLEWIESSALRCKRIVDALLDFSSREENDSRVIDILGLLELNLVLLRNDLESKDILLEVNSLSVPVVVKGDPGQLTQGIFNVLANARDAVSPGGRIGVDVVTRPGQVLISVSDDGPGIPEENLMRIFDPFFSTKEVGQGTGLGLCAARGIIRAHNGDIQVGNQEGGGTRVEVSLPLHEVRDRIQGESQPAEKS